MADGTPALAIPPNAFPIVRTSTGGAFMYTPATGRIFVLLGAYIHAEFQGGNGDANIVAAVHPDTAASRIILNSTIPNAAGSRTITQMRCCLPTDGVASTVNGTVPRALFSIFGYDCDASALGRGKFYAPRIPDGAVPVVRSATEATGPTLYTVPAGRTLVILHTWANLIGTGGGAAGGDVNIQPRDDFLNLHWAMPAAELTVGAGQIFLMPCDYVVEVGKPDVAVTVDSAITGVNGAMIGFSGYEFSRKR